MTSISQSILQPDPGPLPTLPSPNPGDVVEIAVEGLPPRKDVSFSIRNINHRHYDRFLALRNKAIAAMNGRAWYDGAVEMEFVLYAPVLEKEFLGFASGILDTLDGSHGFSFTYLPVVYQDDCQVVDTTYSFRESEETYYTLRFTFL